VNLIFAALLGLSIAAMLIAGIEFWNRGENRRERARELAYAESAQERRFLREAQMEVDELTPMAPPIYDGWGLLAPSFRAECQPLPPPWAPRLALRDAAIANRFQAALVMKRAERDAFLASLVPPDAKAAGVYPVPPSPPPTRAPGPGMKGNH
jgi:hypothetical protein